jgi:CRP-like cAMP-binding protein
MSTLPRSADHKITGLISSLRCCQLFTGLPSEDLAAIASFSLQRVVAKDDYLFRQGSASEGFYVMVRGAINVHRVSAEGKEQVIHVFRTGETFAEAALASPTGYPADARAVEPSTVLVIPKAPHPRLSRPPARPRHAHARFHERPPAGAGRHARRSHAQGCGNAAGQLAGETQRRTRRHRRTARHQTRAGSGTRHQQRNALPHASETARPGTDQRRRQVHHGAQPPAPSKRCCGTISESGERAARGPLRTRGLSEATSNGAPAGFTPGGRRSVGAGCASRILSVGGGVADPAGDWRRVNHSEDGGGTRGPVAASARPPPTGHPQGSLLEGAAPSAPVARRGYCPLEVGSPTPRGLAPR